MVASGFGREVAGRRESDLQKIGCPKDVGMNVSGPQKPTWSNVCAQTLRCFRGQFQVYFPASVLACACAYCCNYGLEWIRNKFVISHSFETVMEPEHLAIQRFAYAIGRVSIWSVQLWIAWLVFTFVLA